MPRKPPRSKDLSVTGARSSALRALSRREHSAAELQQKLRQRGFAGDTAAEAVAAMAEAGWQSDERYAEMLVRNRVQQGYGPQRITHELESGGLKKAEIAAALATVEDDWSALCAALHQRRFGATPTAAADWQKQYRFLASRGFTAAQIRSALKGLPEALE